MNKSKLDPTACSTKIYFISDENSEGNIDYLIGIFDAFEETISTFDLQITTPPNGTILSLNTTQHPSYDMADILTLTRDTDIRPTYLTFVTYEDWQKEPIIKRALEKTTNKPNHTQEQSDDIFNMEIGAY